MASSAKRKISHKAGNRKKAEQLGMPFGTASNRLKKNILFSLVQETGRDSCFRCGEVIKSPQELSVEHKDGWLNVSAELFWDLDNIAFSHLSCNSGYGERKEGGHGIYRYKTGCRCNVCYEAKQVEKGKYLGRKKGRS